MNRSVELIMRHLDEDLPLDRLADTAGFSAFHFHRVFSATTGQTPARFVTSARLDRALTMMTRQPTLPLTEIALACGLGDSSSFSRLFRQRYGTAPSRFDVGRHRAENQERRASFFRADREPPVDPHRYVVETVRRGDRSIACVHVADPYEPGRLLDGAGLIQAWLADAQIEAAGWIGYTWHHPDLVPAADAIYVLGVDVAQNTLVPPPLTAVRVPAMTVARFTLRTTDPHEETAAIDWIFATWLPQSGYQPAQHPTIETWDDDPFDPRSSPHPPAIELPVERPS